MGQYWVCVNLDKKEYIFGHDLGHGIKLWEIAANFPGIQTGLVILLAAQPEPRGGGDFSEDGLTTVGRWVGDRVVLVGDYAEDDDLPPALAKKFRASELYARCREDNSDFQNISGMVREDIEIILERKATCTDYGFWEWEERRELTEFYANKRKQQERILELEAEVNRLQTALNTISVIVKGKHE